MTPAIPTSGVDLIPVTLSRPSDPQPGETLVLLGPGESGIPQ